ncbi:MAG: TIR domain-containing protein [Cyanobacteria bacterium J06555_13]
MNTPNATLDNISFVSTFLSHASTDKDLVEAVAQRLGRRGVLTWFDKSELLEMGPLDVTLKRAVQQQATLTFFLSEASSNSSWCTDELKWAIEAQEGYDHLLPVYLGEPLKLVKEHAVLRSRFLHGDGNRVNQLGYACQQNPTAPDPDAIAQKIAATAYHRSIPKTWSDVVIYLDQRGSGSRRGFPPIPDSVARLNMPTLTFRPSLELRQPRELLTGQDWEDMVQTMNQSLSLALGTIRGDIRKVRVIGNAQTSLVWAVGKLLDRTTSAELYGYDRNGVAITNKGQITHTVLPGGNPEAAVQISGQPLEKNATYKSIALGVGSQDNYGSAVQKSVPDIPLFWLESGFINGSEQAMELVANLVASVKRLNQEYGADELVLFWTTANHVALLAAANLTTHVIPKIRFMERSHTPGEYVHLPMPGDSSS